MNSAGLLSVHALLQNGQCTELAVRLKRPPVTQLFFGQVPEAVVKAVPYLYTLCAQAQRAAAQAACAAALGEPRRAVDDTALWVEMLHEDFWRLLLDWPKALDLEPAQDAFIAWRALRLGEDCLAATQKLWRETLHELAEKCLKKLVDRDSLVPHVAIPLNAETWLAYWQGRSDQVPRGESPLSVKIAYRARLAEVAAAIKALASATPFPIAAAGCDGWGIGQSATARGVLTHAVHVVDGLVARYRVWAPTDLHFADDSALTALLAGREFLSKNEALEALDQAILALDPCLPYSVELNDA
ncbi:MAG: hypothetical protein IPJ38_12965 [Dechloromonas sp.]|uniref:Uncharacterized protein n=1 Tax=Candidatus Dechloromonas phosphorivorans TaxID=2899244 RepID=A0A935JZ34_9RHOO|nr:hypothetical protein [Candidatus Dechloromonas phosphorivorans]